MGSLGNTETVGWRVLDDCRPVADAITRPAAMVGSGTVDAYQSDGIVVLPSAFDEWVEPLRAGLDRNAARPHDYAFPSESTRPDEPGRFFDSYCNWQRIPEYFAFVMTSKAASMAAVLMQSQSAQFFHEHAFVKAPGTQKPTPWHQDLPYYCVDGRQTVSLYVALDHIAAEVAPRFWRGSHTGALHYPRAFVDGANYATDAADLSPVPDVEAIAPSDEVVAVDLKPGDTLAFDFRTLHGSSASTVTTERRAFSTRWLGDDVTFLDRPGETSPPISGHGLANGDRMREDWFPVLWPS